LFIIPKLHTQQNIF